LAALMRILITGAAGMLGLDVQRAAAAVGHETIALGRADLDITDEPAVRGRLEATQPDAVINCAAYTDVDGAESDPAAAHAVNAVGAGLIAAAAAAAGAHLIHVSSDYVFDGEKRTPYLESDATGPLSVYGVSKLAGERAVAAAAPDAHTIVRSSWLFGAGGPCFPATMLRLGGEREQLTVVEDQIGCPTFTGHLAPVLVALAEASRPRGVVHVAAAGECSWFEFARTIFDVARVEVDVRPGATAELGRPAPRPAYSVMRTERGAEVPRLPDWRTGLAAYLQLRVAA
jgi:dTDP-4-dehydrorhamnose reductase